MTSSKKDWIEEIKEKVFERFNPPLSIEDEFLIDTTISEVLKSMREEIEKKKCKDNCTVNKDYHCGWNSALEDLDRIFREKMGDKK